MLGLCVNTYVEANEEAAFMHHRLKASTLDINDLDCDTPEPILSLVPSSQQVDSDDDELPPTAEAVYEAMGIRPISARTPDRRNPEPQGTLAAYTGSSAGTTQDVAPLRTSTADILGTPGGCSTSVSPRREPDLPPIEVLDVLDQRTRPSLERFRDCRRKMKKVPYSELP